MSLTLVKRDNISLTLVKRDNISLIDAGKRYRRDYDKLQLQKKFTLIMNIEELINLETKLTLLEEEENKKIENLVYNKFIDALRLKMQSKYE